MTSHKPRQRATDRPVADPEASSLIGYARVNTGGQSVQRQVDELRKAGCAEILEEIASSADRSRPVLAALLRRIRRGGLSHRNHKNFVKKRRVRLMGLGMSRQDATLIRIVQKPRQDRAMSAVRR